MHDMLTWLESRETEMLDLAQNWADMNTFSANHAGLDAFSQELIRAFTVFSLPVEMIPLPPYQYCDTNGELRQGMAAPALSLSQRPGAEHQILLVGHMDTVHPAQGAFQKCVRLDNGMIQGPGITDMKGGLVVMLFVLQALERCPWKDRIGWRVIINADEEIGSLSSGGLLTAAAAGCHLGLVFEPSLPNGDFVSARKASGNFTLVVRGKAAHAGRNPQEGRSAIDAAAAWITEVKTFFRDHDELTINMGQISGGTARNVVADLAVIRFNVRFHQREVQTYFEEQLPLINHRIAGEHRVKVELHGEFQAPAKPLTDDVRKLFGFLKEAGVAVGLDLNWHASGGVCDGNRLAAGGLPTIDTFGVQGGNIHSTEEYVVPESFVQRAKLGLTFIHMWYQAREKQSE